MKNTAILINSLSSGGAEKVVLTIITQLFKQGIKVHLICIENNLFYQFPSEIKPEVLSNYKGNEVGLLKLISLPYFAWKLKKFVKKNHITLVQSHITRANFVNIISKLIGSKHNVQIVNHGITSRYQIKGILGKINLILIKYLYVKADQMILISKVMGNDINRLIHFKNEQHIIYNPHNISEIIEKSREPIDNINFDKNKKYIISIGRLIPLKRNSDLIRAVSLINTNKTNYSDLEIIFLGEGEQYQSLYKLCQSLKMKNTVHFLGRVINPYKYLVNCNILVSCSESEGFPNVLIESLICGIPVISTDCISGPREILAPGSDINKQLKNEIELAEFGILVPVGKPDKIAEAILTLLNNCKIYQHYCSVGPKRAKDFDINIIVEKYKKVMKIT